MRLSQHSHPAISRWLVTAISATILLACSSTFAAGHPPTPPKGVISLPARPAPGLQLSNMDGEVFVLRSVKGRWTFVHFWASWCGPCRKEMPTIQTLAKNMADNPIDIVLINTAEDDDTVFTFLAAVAPGLDSLMDYDGLVTEAWQPRGLPSTYLVDPQGQIRYVVLGGRPWNTHAYQDFLQQLIVAPKR